MMSAIMIHQPEYLPWINFFSKAALSNRFVLLDSVQYVRRSFQNRNKIKTKHGARWLTVPVEYAPRDQAIMDMKIDNSQNWKERHLKMIKESYNEAAYYREIWPVLEPFYASDWDNLSDLNYSLLVKISEILGINIEFMKSSQLDVTGKGSDLILNICLELGATRYISGIGARAYLEEEKFKRNNIEIVYVPPIEIKYKQEYPEAGFVPDLSIIDYLFNKGPKVFKKDMKIDA